jgi:poly-gamma-glutamate synthesis protein (capsule biosynthesis protein)
MPSEFGLNMGLMNLFLRIIVLCIFPALLWSQIELDSAATIIFTGDLNLAHNFDRAAQHRQIDVFARWKKIGEYDAMVVNLENAVTQSIDSVKKEFVFKMKPSFLAQLSIAGVSLVNCANNHSADFGTEGLLETIRQLDSAKIKHIGIGRNFTEARKPVVLIRNGIKVGFFGYGGVKDYIAERTKPGTTSCNEVLILKDIQKLKSNVDFVVVNLHWGNELAIYPDSSQIALAHRLIDGGADLIIGHHPHVLQGVEQYKGKVIAYSLGNFVFGGNINSMNSETAVLKVCFTKGKIDAQAVPVAVRNWQPSPADSVTAHRVMQLLEERSKMFVETISFIYP